MKILLFTVLLLIFSSDLSIAQTSDEMIRKDVLQKNEIGKTFTYGRWSEDCGDAENKIEFKNEIPDDIFLHCKGKYGDLYSFDRALIE